MENCNPDQKGWISVIGAQWPTVKSAFQKAQKAEPSFWHKFLNSFLGEFREDETSRAGKYHLKNSWRKAVFCKRGKVEWHGALQDKIKKGAKRTAVKFTSSTWRMHALSITQFG